MKQSEIEECKAGLGGDDDWFFRQRLERRLDALNDDEPMFGLVPHEKAEQLRITAILQSKPKGNTNEAS